MIIEVAYVLQEECMKLSYFTFSQYLCFKEYCILNIIFLTSLLKFINHSGTNDIFFGCDNGV